MSSAPLRAESVTLAYDARVVTEGLSVDIPEGGFTAIVGPNACGKSTLLRALSGLLTPKQGAVVLDGAAIHTYRSKEVARRLTGAASLQLVPSMITGALLMVLSDLVAQRLLAPAQLPVGVVTGAVGGIYLAWLLSVQWRKGTT